MSYQALLFDLDNTLIDFSHSEETSLNAIHASFFHEQIAVELFKNHYHNINKDLWRQVEAGQLNTPQVKCERFRLLMLALGLALDYQKIAEHYEAGLVDHAAWYPGVKEALLQLKNNFRLGIITNGLGYVQQAKFHMLELQQLCECYVISELVGYAKPSREIFNIALQQLNLQVQDVLMVGDSVASDYRGALNAGMDFCWVNNRNEILPSGFPAPKYVVDSVAQLPQLLQDSAIKSSFL